ncbi:3'-5' exonuclease [Streptomyces sennicomposti]|uniref:3'-5' exonuclease n=1 Tax=Streptomyces sennicomposti TaxID=2873384 RepID=UPI001CA7AB55|nr:3'-5' exonuclease [Streptomyces sennicomposti]MBY8868723.1 3'-5' exonuclease [Streptomyces sennicomposti]
MGKQKGFGPVQLADHAGLYRWQVDRGMVKGLVPRPALESGRWSDEQADDVAARSAEIREVLGDRQGYGAKRTAELLQDATGVELWSADVETLAARGLIDETGEWKGYTLYDPKVAAEPSAEVAAALREIVEQRVAWYAASVTREAAAGRCGWTELEFENRAREAGMEPGQFGRWALDGVERLAGVEEPDVAGARLFGPDEAAEHMGIRRREFDYCVEAGWLTPVSQITRTVWTGQYSRYSKTVTVPLYRAADLDAVLRIEDVDWAKVRTLKPRQVSPLRKYASQAPKRAEAVRAFVERLRAEHGLVAWCRYANLANRWIVDWEPREDGTPTVEDVQALLAADAGLAPYADTVQLLGEVGRVVHWARRMLQPGAAVLIDTETHDLWGSVMEVAVVDCATGEALLDTLVNPEVPVTPGAFVVHGISDEMVADAPTFDQVLPDLLKVTAGRTLLAYNEEYDREVIKGDCRRRELAPAHLGRRANWDCVMESLTTWEGLRDWPALGGGHRARGDALAALDVLRQMASAPPWVLPKETAKVSA